jgi:hypothetical protein
MRTGGLISLHVAVFYGVPSAFILKEMLRLFGY